MAENIIDLSKSKWDVGVSIGRTNPYPLDSTENQLSKENLTTYAKTGATSYVGQILKVVNNGTVSGCYIIKNKSGDLIELTSKEDLLKAVLDLGPVFKFKGIATAIDPDHTSLTIGEGTINIDSKDFPLISWGTSSKNIFNQVMYAWGTELGILIYTEDPYISDYNSKSLKFYIESGEMTSQYITVFDTIYVNNQNTVNGFDEWIDSLGNLIYTKTNLDDPSILDVYPTSNPDGTVIVYVEPINYTYHSFEEDSTFYDNYTWTVNNLHQEDANSENNGHVYQIGEEEYASNGHMWVQLGSPKTDWIVL